MRPRQVLVAGIARTDVACAAPSSTPSLGIQAPSGTDRRRQPAADSVRDSRPGLKTQPARRVTSRVYLPSLGLLHHGGVWRAGTGLRRVPQERHRERQDSVAPPGPVAGTKRPLAESLPRGASAPWRGRCRARGLVCDPRFPERGTRLTRLRRARFHPLPTGSRPTPSTIHGAPTVASFVCNRPALPRLPVRRYSAIGGRGPDDGTATKFPDSRAPD